MAKALSCGWKGRATFHWPVRGLSEDDYFSIITGVSGIGEFQVEPEGASNHPTVHKTELETSSRCPACKSWSIRPDGLITLRGDVLAWNAYGGARVGTKVTLVDNCPSNKTDCQWDFTPEGFIVSRTNPKLAVRANMRPHFYDQAPLVLVDNCTATWIGCTWRRVGSPR